MNPETRRTSNRYPRLTEDIRKIISAYATHEPPRDKVVLCQPREVELRFYPSPGNPPWVGNNGKVCYPSQMNAEAAASAIRALDGADPVVSYQCPRGGHWHHVAAARRTRTTINIIEWIAAAATRRTGDRG